MPRDGGVGKFKGENDRQRWKDGFANEDKCAEYVKRTFPDVINTRNATFHEDTAGHIDFFAIVRGKKEVAIDAKAMKEIIPGKGKNPNYHFIELRNVRNNPGCIMGKAWGHAFQVGEDDYIFVSNRRLQQLAKRLMLENGLDIQLGNRRFIPLNADPEDIVGKMVVTSRREGRDDAMLVVKTEWLKELQENPFRSDYVQPKD